MILSKYFRRNTKPSARPNRHTRYYVPIPHNQDTLEYDILTSPHTLIAGTTGSGKSVLLNSIISVFMSDFSVSNQLYMIDPKRIELSQYKVLPHCTRYTSDVDEAISILDDVLYIVESRYKEMEKRNIRQYDGPHVYVIIDELADIMISPSAKAFKLKLQKILQIARASNIHVIACTQAPSRQIIPASIVLNFTNRVALRCLSAIESRQIITVSGAENLPQYGKALYLSPKRGIIPVDITMTPQSAIDDSIYEWTQGCMIVR